MNPRPDWLNWARTIQAVAQTGLAFAENPFERERYQKLHALAVEIFAAHTGRDAATIEQWFAVQPGYATPKVDVRGACFRDGQILLVREKSDGRWCLPGGWADTDPDGSVIGIAWHLHMLYGFTQRKLSDTPMVLEPSEFGQVSSALFGL